jgi:16S rRNA (cytosine1402-N4)-methyltransferase
MAHIPVLLEETIDGLDLKAGSVYVDGTLGSGGHAKAVWEKTAGKVTIVGFDREQDALKRSEVLLKSIGAKPILINQSFRTIATALLEHGIKGADAVLFDIGISSVQLDDSKRGFSFLRDEPLLMTMRDDVTKDTLTAKDLLNTLPAESIASIIYAYGEETFSRKIAATIVAKRDVKPFETTFELVEAINESVPNWYKKGKTHPATKTFQALRIAVNDELQALTEGITGAVSVLNPKGRLAVITFHSLEDRIVKNMFRDLQKEGLVTIITKKPIGPTAKETKTNSRSRSAKLRIIEKI